jgi:hypothetical protein
VTLSPFSRALINSGNLFFGFGNAHFAHSHFTIAKAAPETLTRARLTHAHHKRG